jgi:hypothetical protein
MEGNSFLVWQGYGTLLVILTGVFAVIFAGACLLSFCLPVVVICSLLVHFSPIVLFFGFVLFPRLFGTIAVCLYLLVIFGGVFAVVFAGACLLSFCLPVVVVHGLSVRFALIVVVAAMNSISVDLVQRELHTQQSREMAP